MLEILKSELLNVFGLCAASEEREVNTFKSSVFTLLRSSCSSSRFDRAGFKCLKSVPYWALLLLWHTHTRYSSTNGTQHRMQLYTGSTPEEVEMFINSVGQKSADTGWSSSMPQN